MAALETRNQQAETSWSIPMAMLIHFTNAHLGSSAVTIVQVLSSFCGRCHRIILYHGPIIDTPDAKKRRALPATAMSIITLSLISAFSQMIEVIEGGLREAPAKKNMYIWALPKLRFDPP